MENRFNLIDQPWIPVADVGRVSLRDIFSCPEYRMLGGNPTQKIALLKLLQAIAQAAVTPEDEQHWQTLGWQGMAQRVIEYLEQWHDRFYLYGEHPFLQMPAIINAALKPFGTVLPEVATGNTSVLTQIQVEKLLDDGDKALLLLSQMAYALGGKKTDNSLVLTAGYRGKTNEKGKAATAKPGSAVGHMGLLHNFCIGSSILKTIWLNLFTQSEIAELKIYPHGLGCPPWQQMPQGEDCSVAKQLKGSLIGRLIPLGRFCLLTPEGLHYSEGIAHSNYKEGIFDPSAAIDFSGKEPKARWTDPEYRPWRELSSLLSFIGQQHSNFQCIQLRLALNKARRQQEKIAIWSGGLRVSSNAGEQYVSGSDDMVESLCWLEPRMLQEIWFIALQKEMAELEQLAKTLYGCVSGYYRTLLVDGAGHTAQATVLFWQLCERHAQALVDGCEQSEIRYSLRRQFAHYAQQVFDQMCAHQTARQLEAWAKTKPNFALYLKQEKA
ncbi:type I-E CRISPR-associated protein Cse1/CasA [Serratia microhaemolytica]|uniref:type I-E CRISPR-associated protein Cse1/CasA n=1 Tax=Serratia microhaemolytica TaxID=2675110 RepID=UPI000FDCF3EC|nr:type I-E CRISPR-associated protein Cse1/CasA [Serratia microhaemolytica]